MFKTTAQDQADPTGFGSLGLGGAGGSGGDISSPDVNVDVDPTTGQPKVSRVV
jgi:hypothetical protein